ncbi:hypothetical protein BJ878DRAFT_125458 [Calycina marina]|uniref:Uncharacterized protein n=1 Tax=Calycina marina TaxID=1763456 RepID=A0A9P7Z1R3_9HELO|nr:hypothetical protein BJ878DRAFT_125458 [Calycina marina]
MHPPLVQGSPPQLQDPVAVNPALLYRNMPIRSRYPTSLCPSIGRSQYHLWIVGETVKSRAGRSHDHRTREGGVWLRISPSPPVRRLQADWHIRVFSQSSGVSAANPAPAPGPVPLADPPGNAPARVSYDPAASNQPRATEAPNASCTCSTGGTTRQKPGCIIVRHFCDWLLTLQRGQAESTASQSPERAAVRGGDGATRQIARGSGRCRARSSANARRTCEGIRVTAAQQHRDWTGRSWILVEAAPHLAGAVFSAAAWPSGRTWRERARILGRKAACA